MKVFLLSTVLLTAAVGGVIAQTASTAAPAVLADGTGAKPGRVDKMNRVRYVELFLAAREANTGKLVAACYNTMFSSAGIPASKDTAPQAWVEGHDFTKIAKEYGVLNASLNGPKLWLPPIGPKSKSGSKGTSTALRSRGSPN